MANTGVEVQRQGDQIKLIMPGNITFATDSANIAPSFYSPLNNLAGSFKQFNQNTIEVVGFTDSTGSRKHNMDLSKRRADAVAAYLAEKGLNTANVRTVGYGESRQVNTGAVRDDPGAEANRRVVFVVETSGAAAATTTAALPQ